MRSSNVLALVLTATVSLPASAGAQAAPAPLHPLHPLPRAGRTASSFSRATAITVCWSASSLRWMAGFPPTIRFRLPTRSRSARSVRHSRAASLGISTSRSCRTSATARRPLLDAYFDIRFSPKFRIRSGKDKTPVGYELLIGDAFLLFPERSLASSLVPNRDVGVAAQGDLSPKFYYAAGVFNGIGDGASSSTDVDTNNGKDLAGRIVVQPFRSTQTPSGALNGLGFQIGGSTGKQTGRASGLPDIGRTDILLLRDGRDG